MINPRVILVDKEGKTIGTTDRASAHGGTGKLHRAFSIFIFNNKNLLLQKRAPHKLFGNLWTNTCCSHVKPSTSSGHVAQSPSLTEQAKIRLEEEFGFKCSLTECGSFIYKAYDKTGTEYEYDTVLTGEIPDDSIIKADPTEISEWKWMNVKELQKDLEEQPYNYTPWLAQALQIAFSE